MNIYGVNFVYFSASCKDSKIVVAKETDTVPGWWFILFILKLA
jgi:hypothetical protein